MQQQFQLWTDPEGSAQGGVQAPGEFIKRELEKRGWGQADLAAVIKRPLPTVNEIINAKRAVTPEMAVALGNAFSTPPELWAHREAAYRISLVTTHNTDTAKLAKLYEVAPIKDLQRRGWIGSDITCVRDLTDALLRFMDCQSLEENQVPTALARKAFADHDFSNAQRAWLMQSAHMARKVNVRNYSRDGLIEGLPKIKRLALKPEQAAKLPLHLAELGVRFIVVEDLPHTRIDGAAFFLDGDELHPVIVLSMRLDRMDSFWHTVAHELRHIINRDPFSIDADIVGESREAFLNSVEETADKEAANWLVDDQQLKRFVLRAKPWFAKESILPFATRMGVHPSIVIGQLQNFGVLAWDKFSEMRPKVRDYVLMTAVCDGYGIRLK